MSDNTFIFASLFAGSSRGRDSTDRVISRLNPSRNTLTNKLVCELPQLAGVYSGEQRSKMLIGDKAAVGIIHFLNEHFIANDTSSVFSKHFGKAGEMIGFSREMLCVSSSI